MNKILDAASAWFFDSVSQSLDGTLRVNLVEGIKAQERQYVEVGETRLGPYFQVSVESTSRCVQIVFPGARSFYVCDESFTQQDPALKKGQGRFLFEAENSSFREFSEVSTSLFAMQASTVKEYVLCCEDRTIHVLSEQNPAVQFLDESPNVAIERTRTWFAS